MREDPEGKGWFVMPGLQGGDRTLAEQLQGLEPLFGEAADLSILDLGCAEGLISLELMRAGASLVHGVESVESRVQTARLVFRQSAIVGTRTVEFFVADLAEFPYRPPAGLLRQYDLVLLLSIVHKFRDPDVLLQAAAERARHQVALRLPDRVINDRRSGNRSLDVPRLMEALGFRLAHEAPGPRGEWVGLFRRR